MSAYFISEHRGWGFCPLGNGGKKPRVDARFKRKSGYIIMNTLFRKQLTVFRPIRCNYLGGNWGRGRPRPRCRVSGNDTVGMTDEG